MLLAVQPDASVIDVFVLQRQERVVGCRVYIYLKRYRMIWKGHRFYIDQDIHPHECHVVLPGYVGERDIL